MSTRLSPYKILRAVFILAFGIYSCAQIGSYIKEKKVKTKEVINNLDIRDENFYTSNETKNKLLNLGSEIEKNEEIEKKRLEEEQKKAEQKAEELQAQKAQEIANAQAIQNAQTAQNAQVIQNNQNIQELEKAKAEQEKLNEKIAQEKKAAEIKKENERKQAEQARLENQKKAEERAIAAKKQAEAKKIEQQKAAEAKRLEQKKEEAKQAEAKKVTSNQPRKYVHAATVRTESDARKEVARLGGGYRIQVVRGSSGKNLYQIVSAPTNDPKVLSNYEAQARRAGTKYIVKSAK